MKTDEKQYIEINIHTYLVRKFWLLSPSVDNNFEPVNYCYQPKNLIWQYIKITFFFDN